MLALLALAIAGCSRTSTPPPAAETAKSETAKPADVITLDAAAQKAAGVVVEAAETKPVELAISAPGQLVFNEERTWSTGALTDGRIASVRIKLGDSVKEGQILATVHSHEVHDSRADLQSAEQEVQRAESAEALAVRQRDRAQRLFKLTAISREQLENAEQEVRNAEAATRNAKIAVTKARTHLTEYLDVKPDSEEHEVPVRAPASGIVIERKATSGTVVSAGQELFRISDAASLWLIAAVNESDLPALRVGQNVRVTVRAYADRGFGGSILRMGEQLDPATRTLQVRVRVPNPGGLLKPGMFASVDVQRGASRSALFVRAAAVQDVNGQPAVFVRITPDSFAVRPLQLGRPRDGDVEVTGGLQSGDQVVTKGSFILKSQLLKGSLAEE
ncbi:MAG TPA: efflux RND transporter periplasmic adaptor subunit [Bryobacteraceae bacterium]|nr:efflux RND transporter periplasmic adaptor subunit [Bryobacteraceae bacterium]